MAVEVHPAKAVRQTPYQRQEAAAARTQEKQWNGTLIRPPEVGLPVPQAHTSKNTHLTT